MWDEVIRAAAKWQVWMYGFMDAWIHGFMDLWICGSMDPYLIEFTLLIYTF